MRHINLETWPRREHFKVFSSWDYPHFSMCANVDLTTFYPVVKQRGISFNVAIVHPSATILTDEDLFSFCTFDYIENFSEFAARAAERIAYVKEDPTLKDEPGQDDLLFMTAIPWVSFTSFMHPLHLHPVDSVPRFAWGKFFEDGKFLKMPLSVQGHHALMDGIHVGRFYAKVQDYLRHPGSVLGEA